MRARLSAAVLSAVLLLGACSDDKSDSPAATSGSTTEQEAAPAAAEPDGLVVIEQGAAPRRALRVTPTEGQQEAHVMTMDLQLQQSIGGEQQPSALLPAMRITIRSTVTDVADDGDITMTFEYTDAQAVATEGVDQATMDAVNESFRQMNGVKGSTSVTASGIYLDGSFDTSALEDESMKQQLDSFASQMESLTVPFPTAAIGTGARWTVERSAELSGITNNLTMTYKLVELTDAGYKLEVTQEGTAPAGPVDLPGVPASAKVSIKSYDLDSRGETAGEFRSAFPKRAAIDGTGVMVMEIVEDGETTTLNQEMDIGMVLEAA